MWHVEGVECIEAKALTAVFTPPVMALSHFLGHTLTQTHTHVYNLNIPLSASGTEICVILLSSLADISVPARDENVNQTEKF